MSRKHRHRADNRPVTRRYVLRVVTRARDEILAALIHTQHAAVMRDLMRADTTEWLDGEEHVGGTVH